MFAFCDDGDVLEATLAPRASLTIDGPFGADLSTRDNLVMRAAEATGITAQLHLTKILPVASGIGGGSADAAATIRLLCRLADRAVPPLMVQRALGADVPACVISQTARGSGIGEALSNASSVAGTPILLVNPRVPLSTKAVFAAWDRVDRGPLGDWQAGRNDLEAPARALVPAIGAVLEWLGQQSGTSFVRMSGSGATCFALFDSAASRDVALRRGRSDCPTWWFMSSTLR